MHRLAAAVQAQESTAVTINDLRASLAQATATADQLSAVQLALRYASVTYTTKHNNNVTTLLVVKAQLQAHLQQLSYSS
jgi:hypothetical protein